MTPSEVPCRRDIPAGQGFSMPGGKADVYATWKLTWATSLPSDHSR